MPANSENLIAPLLKLASYVHSDSSGIVIAPTPANEQTIDVPTPATTDNVTNRDPLLDKLKDHIVQIESLLAYIILFVGGSVLVESVLDADEAKHVLKFMSLAFLAGVVRVIRVTNPTSADRNRFSWASSGGALGGIVVGAICEILTGGLTGGEGMIWGGAGGALIGGVCGDWINGWGKQDKLLDRGQAFDFLYERKSKSMHVANGTLIEDALSNHIAKFDKNSDGRAWYARESLEEFVVKGPTAR